MNRGIPMGPTYMDKPGGYYSNVSPLVVQLLELPPGARVLDVGCAEGSLGEQLKHGDPSVFVAGVEMHGPAAERAEEVLDEVWQSDFETWAPPAHCVAGFDRIVFGDVLEHLVNPEAALHKARTLLRPDGAIVASVPNVRWLPIVRDLAIRGEWTYRAEGILDDTHLRFFTKSSIRALFERCSLHVEECVPSFSTQWGVAGRILRLLARRSGTFEEFCTFQYILRARLPASLDD